jgi:hypothetical protein
MVKCCVFFAVGIESLDIIQMSFGFKWLIGWMLLVSESTVQKKCFINVATKEKIRKSDAYSFIY